MPLTEEGDLIPLVDDAGNPVPWAADEEDFVPRPNESDLFYVLPDGEMIRIGGATLDPPGLDLLGVHIAKRHQARQQQGGAVRVAQEGVAQGQAGAPGGQQQGEVHEGVRRASEALTQAEGQAVDEGHAGRDG